MTKRLSNYDKLDRLCTIIPGILSIIGIILIILSILFFSKLKTNTFYLLLFQSISEIIFNLSILIFYNPPLYQTWECQFQGFLINYGIISSILFSGIIAGHMYYIIKKRTYKLTRNHLIILTVTIVLLSGGIACIPYSTHQYEDLGANCWIAAQGEYDTKVKWGIVMRFATHYGIIWSVCIFCAWCYITIFRYVKEVREALRQSALTVTNERSEVERTVYRLQYYPAILIFCWLGITACRLYSSFYPERLLPIWALGSSHFILNLQGFLNTIVFFSYRSVWDSWLKLFGINYQSFNRTPVNSRQQRSFGQSASNSTNVPSNDQSNSKQTFSSRFNELLSRNSDVSFSTRLVNLLFGIQEVRNPLGSRDTEEMHQKDKLSTSYLYDNETSSSHDNQESEVGSIIGLRGRCESDSIIENPINDQSLKSGYSSTNPRNSRLSNLPLPPPPPSTSLYPTESPVSTRFLSTIPWLQTNTLTNDSNVSEGRPSHSSFSISSQSIHCSEDNETHI